ncbi:MAG: hypothetical protein WC302_03575, partial [Candidatus Paceibacterota bacterium]
EQDKTGHHLRGYDKFRIDSGLFNQEIIMPFRKRGRYYYSPSGRKYTARQVRFYYASKKTWKRSKTRRKR